MSNQLAPEAALDALGHPMRRRMLEVLRDGARPVGELAERLPIGRPAVSKHLRVLEGAGLVEHRSRGTRNLYAVAPAGLAGVQAWLSGLWDVRLASFAAYVAEQTAPTAPDASAAAPTESPDDPSADPHRQEITP